MDLPHAVSINGHLYGYGNTRMAARDDFLRQISGASPYMRRHMLDRAYYELLTDEDASEVAECISADVLVWED